MKQSLVLGSVVVFALAGCGGGSSDGGDQEGASSDAGIAVVATSPASDASEANRSAPVTATFNKDVFATTVSDTSFTLASDSPIDGTVTFDALTNTATFTPAEALAMLTTYSATLSTDITDLSGDPLNASYNWSFTTADGTLSAAAESVQSDSSVSVNKPRIAYSDDGQAISVWYEMNLSTFKTQVLASHYTAGGGWGTPFLLQTDPEVNGADPQLASDGAGNAIAIWREAGTEVWASRYISATDTWEAPENIGAAADWVGDFSIDLNADGAAVAIWGQRMDLVTSIEGNAYKPGVGWGSAEPIEIGDDNAYGPEVAVDESGNAIAVWTQKDGTQFSMYSNRFSAETGWGGATLIESLETGASNPIYNPQLAMDGSGNALVVWVHNNGTSTDLWFNRFDVNTGWQGEALLETHEPAAESPVLTMNNSGTAMVIWAKEDPSSKFLGFASRVYTPDAGWGVEETFDYSAADFDEPSLVIDDRGHVLFVWSYDDGTNSNLWFNRYRATTGWTSATELNRLGDDYGDFSPQLALKSDGEAMLIFASESLDVRELWTRLFN
ncbi:Ig-like domain-containing protein [Marinobacter sp. F4216]|uniref:Ig-like domain-containing protein n=1 Tax=Marinobacter sp. F4216 TaxID=2874281 RepID=UPI001CBD5C49|nr:Ig-like domain-containing protein [Marinobacter sp. F4216]MBZ2169065.1 Ig-like domain-containing protein [Marinobacter sp. F4216]